MRRKRPIVNAIGALVVSLVAFNWVLLNLRLAKIDKRNESIPFKSIKLPSRLLHLKSVWDSLPIEDHLVIPNALTRTITSERDDVTLTVHLSPSTKLQRFLFLLNRWDGPSSVAIYISRPDEIPKFLSFCKENWGNRRFRMASFHVILEKGNEYPQNRLRELAVQFVRGSFVALDVDHITPPRCHEKLKKMIESDKELSEALRSKTIFVLPAFEYRKILKDDELRDNVLPNNKKEVVTMVQRKELAGFHMAEFEDGQKPTNYTKWYSNTDGSSFYFIEYGMKFEPYVLAYRDDEGNLPHYWEEFRGFGYDK